MISVQHCAWRWMSKGPFGSATLRSGRHESPALSKSWRHSENFKPPVVEGHKFERFDPLLACNQQLFRQTDGSRFVVSLRAILNSDFHKDLALQRDLPFNHHSA